MPASLSIPAAIVLRRVDVGEAHRLVEFLTPEQGLVTALARGARASRKRFAGTLELFATLGLQLQRRGQTQDYSLQAADVQTLRLGLRQDYDRLIRAACLSRCVQALAAPQQAAARLFMLLTKGLDACDRGQAADSALLYPYFLKAAGLLPRAACVRCGATDRPLGLLSQEGCLGCRSCCPTALLLAPRLVQALCCSLAPPIDEKLARQLESCVLQMVGIHLGRQLPLPTYSP
jgi:DNA repair protein RecO (recombination protein O)